MAENTFNAAYVKKVTRRLSGKAFKDTEWKFPGVEPEKTYTTDEVKKEIRNFSKVGRFVLQIFQKWKDHKETRKKKQRKAKGSA